MGVQNIRIMGIQNIHFLINPEPPRDIHLQVQAAKQVLINAHRRGEHPWGSMRRDCLLCQLDK